MEGDSKSIDFFMSRVWGRHSPTSSCPGWKMERKRNLETCSYKYRIAVTHNSDKNEWNYLWRWI